MRKRKVIELQNITKWFLSYLKKNKIPHKHGTRQLAQFYYRYPLEVGSILSDTVADDMLDDIRKHYESTIGGEIIELCVKEVVTSAGQQFGKSNKKYSFVKFSWSAKPKNMFSK